MYWNKPSKQNGLNLEGLGGRDGKSSESISRVITLWNHRVNIRFKRMMASKIRTRKPCCCMWKSVESNTTIQEKDTQWHSCWSCHDKLWLLCFAEGEDSRTLREQWTYNRRTDCLGRSRQNGSKTEHGAGCRQGKHGQSEAPSQEEGQVSAHQPNINLMHAGTHVCCCARMQS